MDVKHSPVTTFSTARTEVINGNHVFKIAGYSLNKGLGTNKYIESNKFSIGGYDWTIKFYPEGDNSKKNASYVSLFIALASEGTDVRASFELLLMDQSGKNRHHRVHSGQCSFESRGSTWGYYRYFKRSSLDRSYYIKDDCLLLHCSIGVIKSQTVVTEAPQMYNTVIQATDMYESDKRRDSSTDIEWDTKRKTKTKKLKRVNMCWVWLMRIT